MRDTLELNDKLLMMNQDLLDRNKRANELILGAADQIDFYKEHIQILITELNKMIELGWLPKITVTFCDTALKLEQALINGNR